MKKADLLTLLVGMWTDTVTVENSMQILQKTKTGTTIWPKPNPLKWKWEIHLRD